MTQHAQSLLHWPRDNEASPAAASHTLDALTTQELSNASMPEYFDNALRRATRRAFIQNIVQIVV